MTGFIPGELIFFKFFITKLPNFGFPVYGIILYGFYGLKGVAFSLIALFSINTRFKTLGGVIIYKVLFNVLTGYVFGAALGFLLRVLRVIGLAVFGCGFWAFVWILRITVSLW